MVLLAKHPRVQTKLREELKKYPKERPENIEYFNCVVKECNRILPVAAMVSSRKTGRDFEFTTAAAAEDSSSNSSSSSSSSNDEEQRERMVLVPKGAICLLPQVIPNYDPQVYPNPKQFRPERWEPHNITKEMTAAYLSPFTVGSRTCPGQALATAEINSALPRMIMNYEVELVDEGKPDFFLTWKYQGAQCKVRKIVS
jgi:cytochrome P450